MKDKDFLNECYTSTDMSWLFTLYPGHRKSFTSHIEGLKNIDDIEDHNSKKFRNTKKRP